MEELVKQLTQKFGLDAEKAKGIIQTVVAHIQSKLPGPMGDQVAKLLGGGAGPAGPAAAGAAEKAKGVLGGLGGKP